MCTSERERKSQTPERQKMTTEEMIKTEIADIESSILYDKRRLEQDVKEFKDAVQRYTVCEIACGYLDSSLRMIQELYAKITAANDMLYCLRSLIAPVTDSEDE